MEPSTPLETLCRIILRAREYEAQVPSGYDDDEEPDNIDDTGEEALSVLDDEVNSSVEEELRGILDDLADDQIAEVLAFCWVGAGTYDASEWSEALEAAAEEGNQVEELLELPMMASVLEAGLAAFDLSCAEMGELA
ncbi:DUF3775 domain-containing protein [Sphingomonas mesophila]|uniref:DUF3775 domain-containing protein n=1 Tax=Sphingomonas mesophila TaxID=2303576 RepID=UPI000E5892BC|nr:DUF3775 domain-containing protein [Sphingomonas mesophila]